MAQPMSQDLVEAFCLKATDKQLMFVAAYWAKKREEEFISWMQEQLLVRGDEC